MSSIIDALKKSDQNRNNENNSDLNNINFSNNTESQSRRGFWLLVVLLLLIAFAVFAWQQGWAAAISNYAKSWSSQTAAKTKPAMAKTQQTIQPVVKQEPITKNIHENQLVPPKQSEIKAQTKKINQQQTQQEPVASSVVAKKEEMIAVKRESDQPTAIDKTKESISTTAKAGPTAEQSKPEQVVKKPDTDKPKDRSLEPTLKQDYLLLHQIDYVIRKDIPEIKINIHIYDPIPENRMVLINGERFSIGDTIAESVNIEDIVQEGIVVTFENIRFLIPK